MASSITLYNKVKQYIMDGTLDLDTNTINVALVASSYTPAATHDIFGDVTGELSSGGGYTAGGASLTGKAVTFTDTPSAGKFDANDLTWTSLTATFRYGVIYAVGTLNGIVNPLIGYIVFDTTPADISLSGVDFTIQWNASGILTLT